jgi:hypothetical protein
LLHYGFSYFLIQKRFYSTKSLAKV